MGKLRRFAGVFVITALVGVCALSATAAEPAGGAPAMTPVPMTPVSRAGVTIVLPSGAVITLPETDGTTIPYEKKGDHVVGEELC